MMNAWREFRQSSYFVGNVNQFTFCFHAEKNDKFLLVQQSLQFFLFPSINLESESELFRRKFEELKLSYDVDGVSYHHQKGTDMAIRSGEKGTKFALTFFPSLN